MRSDLQLAQKVATGLGRGAVLLRPMSQESPVSWAFDVSWTPTREAGLIRLTAFTPSASRAYTSGRNADKGPGRHQSVSGLSPYLRHRLLLDDEVLHSVLARHSLTSAEKFIDEVFWRSYFKGWLEHHPRVWSSYVEDCESLRRGLREDARLQLAFSDAIWGRTGIGPFDAWVRELRATGYLHNHARMWFASVWIFTLGLPWQLGALWFHYHLLDGDAASNTLSWRWVAGLHTKGKTYLARAENIRRHAGERLEFDGSPLSFAGIERLAGSATALTEAPHITAREIPTWPESNDLKPGGRVGLLLHDEDLSLRLPFQPTALAVLSPQRVSRRRAAREVARFGLGAVSSTLSEATKVWALESPAPILRSHDGVLRWLRSAKLDRLLIPYVPQGPSRIRLMDLLDKVAEQGVETQVFMRSLDQAAWPHAKKGFFGLRKQIPDILERLELGLRSPVQFDLLSTATSTGMPQRL